MIATKEHQITFHRIELPTPLPVGPVNAFVVSSGDKNVLVDCGPKYPDAQSVLTLGLRELGLEFGDLDGLVLTHGHVDHVGLCATLGREGVPVYAPPLVDTWLTPGGEWDRYRAEFFLELYTNMGMPKELAEQTVSDIRLLHRLTEPATVDVELTYGTELPCMPEFEVLHVPGHAQHACALYSKSQRVLIAGDQLLSRISSNALIEPKMTAETGRMAKRTKSLLQYRDNLRELLNLDIDIVYPGHGDVFGDVKDLILQRLESQEKRKCKFKEMVRHAANRTTFGIATAFFPKHWDQLQLIMSETLGYLDWLAHDGELREVVNGEGEHTWELV